jgi:hypothetical protein
MNDTEAEKLIDAFCFEILENCIRGIPEPIRRSGEFPDFWWQTHLPECDLYLFLVRKKGPNPRPMCEFQLVHPEEVPMGDYYLTVEFNPYVIGEQETLAMLRGIQHEDVYVRFEEDTE